MNELLRNTVFLLSTLPAGVLAAGTTCEARSSERLVPVIELYTSEGCSSCPPADQWLSTLKGKNVVAQAFHVDYWDYIGWVDRFATPANTIRQRAIAASNRLRNIYTPQVVRNGRDWRNFASAANSDSLARASIVLNSGATMNDFEARVVPGANEHSWSAYWTVTEHGHQSRVNAGENSGATLQHDFVVRQYTPVGTYQGIQTLSFSAIASKPGHPRQINLVVTDPQTGATLQGISLSCG